MGMPDEEIIHAALCVNYTNERFYSSFRNSSNGSAIVPELLQDYMVMPTEVSNTTMTSPTAWNVTTSGMTSHTSPPHGRDFRLDLTQILYEKVLVVICALGLLGNLLNIVVLTQKSLLYTLGRMEKFVYAGLISLAVSDMLFCGCVVPHGFVEENGFSHSLGFSQFFHAYSNGIINIFIMSSTWLTVTMAIGRYFVMCHPFRAREVIGLTFAARSMVGVFVLCVLFNIPRFWIFKIAEVRCSDEVQYFYVRPGYIRERQPLYEAYMWLYFSVCILVPLVVLTCCNVALIRALRNSVTTRRRIRHGTSPHGLDSSSRITLTLIIIVLMYIFLVCPAELITFLREMTLLRAVDPVDYDLAVAVVNTLQALNFSLNFLLYCAMNAHFRRTMTYLVQCRGMGVNLGLGRQISQKNSYGMQNTVFSRTSSTTTRASSLYHVVASSQQAKPRTMSASMC